MGHVVQRDNLAMSRLRRAKRVWKSMKNLFANDKKTINLAVTVLNDCLLEENRYV